MRGVPGGLGQRGPHLAGRAEHAVQPGHRHHLENGWHATAFVADPPPERAVVFQFGGGVRPVAQLVLEPLQGDRVAGAVGQHPRQQEAGQALRRLREGEEDVVHRRRGEPFVPGQPVDVARRDHPVRPPWYPPAGRSHPASRSSTSLPADRLWRPAGAARSRRCGSAAPVRTVLPGPGCAAARAPRSTSSRWGTGARTRSASRGRSRRRGAGARAGRRPAPTARPAVRPRPRGTSGCARPGGSRPRRSGDRPGRGCAARADGCRPAGPPRCISAEPASSASDRSCGVRPVPAAASPACSAGSAAADIVIGQDRNLIADRMRRWHDRASWRGVVLGYGPIMSHPASRGSRTRAGRGGGGSVADR